jgi:hypothetical protein
MLPRKSTMPRYLVERHLPGFSPNQLPGAAALAKSASDAMAQEGTPVRYLRSTFIPGEDKCYCLFEAPSPEAVRAANERAGLPFERVLEAVFVASEDLP